MWGRGRGGGATTNFCGVICYHVDAGGLVVGENICITAWAGNIFSYVL